LSWFIWRSSSFKLVWDFGCLPR